MKAPLVSADGKPLPSRARNAWWRFVEHRLPILVIYLMVATLVAVVLAPLVLVTVPSGYVGVLWKRFGGGTVLDPRQLRDEGMRFILPWNKLFLYDLRLQSATETYNAISKDGISLTAAINIRYRLKRESIPQLHQSIGPNYVNALVIPEIGNRMREVISEYHRRGRVFDKTSGNSGQDPQRAEAMLGEKMMEGGQSDERTRRMRPTGFRSMPCSTLSIRSFSASSCRPPWSPRSIARSSSITSRRSTSFALRAK